MVFLVFPDQLFETSVDVISAGGHSSVLLVEDPLFFYDARLRPYAYHRLKLAHSRACMKFYEAWLRRHTAEVEYLDWPADRLGRAIAETVDGVVETYHPNDALLRRKLERLCAEAGKSLRLRDDSPAFLLRHGDEIWSQGWRRQAAFLRRVKERLGVLVDVPNHDAQNRAPMTAAEAREFRELAPPPPSPSHIHQREAIEYVERHPRFGHNPGELTLTALSAYPCTFVDARRLLRHFLYRRLARFGRHQDVFLRDWTWLHHSNLSCVLNNGLLPVAVVVSAAWRRRGEVPDADLEGFLRQVLGWREYMRYLYHVGGCDERHLAAADRAEAGRVGSLRPLYPRPTTERLWLGNALLEAEAAKVERTAYAHHIVRLMVFLNWFVISRARPSHVVRWFSERFVDAYPWVMLSNVLAMGSYDARYTRKRYTTSSAYLRRMSDYGRGGSEWATHWDDTYAEYLRRLEGTRAP